MKRYIGLDAHGKSSTFVVLNERGKETARQVVETNGRALISFVKVTPGYKELVFEEGTQSQWLFEILSPHADKTVVAHIGAVGRGQKNDALDAKNLAESLRTGSLKTMVFKAHANFIRLRALVRTYNRLVQDRTRVQNRIKAMFRSWGLAAESRKFFTAQRRSEEMRRLPESFQKSAEILFFQLDVLQDIVKEAELEVIKEAEKFSSYHILKTCPGFGPLRSAEMLSIVVTPARFRRRAQYWAYAGLGVVMRSSSDWEQASDGSWNRATRLNTRGLNRNRNARLKMIYKGAATAIVGFKISPLYDYYQRQLDQGTNPSLAKVSLARKLAIITLTMWKRKEAFDPDKV